MKSCPHCQSQDIYRKGHYFVIHTRSYRRRYRCKACKKSFSNQTSNAHYRQKRPELNLQLFKLLTSGNTLRGSARLLGCTRGTVERKFKWLCANMSTLETSKTMKRSEVIFIDEMESIEHTKLKPLTIPLCVDNQYQILGTSVGKIPAKGHLAAISIKKYGPRESERLEALHQLFSEVKSNLKGQPLEIVTDEAPIYKALIKSYFPGVKHTTVSSRSMIEKKRELVFQAERKKIFDPMFALNQRCAMLRQDIRRLARRSWCTTKIPQRLALHLKLYQLHNNQIQTA